MKSKGPVSRSVARLTSYVVQEARGLCCSMCSTLPGETGKGVVGGAEAVGRVRTSGQKRQ